jgi:hypothetical protein
MNGRRVPHLFAALGAACLLLGASVARADDGANLQAAQALHDKAVALMAQKNYDEALPQARGGDAPRPRRHRGQAVARRVL